ncbi:MAG: hypothetical protein HC796_04845 [Synechococcaceae cyanobacterium RL_1_2]|nr:hypothetical protein [Synechococcaceae cyanobacterium RL_1_2]
MAQHGKWFQQGDLALGFSLLISGGGGLLMALATAPIGWWLGAWVGMIPLWYYPQKFHGPWQQQAWIAIAWGLGFYGVALWWITGIHPLTWLGVPWAGSIAITVFVG